MTAGKLKREDMDELDIELRASNAVSEEDYSLLKKMNGKSIGEILKILMEENDITVITDDERKNNTGG